MHDTMRNIVCNHSTKEKFVHTPEPIWAYNTTSYAMLPCRVDVMYNLTDPFILFHRSYFSGITKMTEEMMGAFSPEHENRMFVGPQDIVFYTVEQLMYTSINGSCGIVMVRPLYDDFDPWFDLRIKNSSTEFGPDIDCVVRFNQIGQQGQLLYTPDCQAKALSHGSFQRQHGTPGGGQILQTAAPNEDQRSKQRPSHQGPPGTRRPYTWLASRTYSSRRCGRLVGGVSAMLTSCRNPKAHTIPGRKHSTVLFPNLVLGSARSR
ncbi:uncharacterized protein LOC142587570 isoform X2 [Dermacentor variabilis]|uniref:uncharacterized protein LOC142587570 isoform X2 n=1 Tax=Dermacentor variabilis TaxID=34621 RepID=UPI003F5AEB9D